METIPFFGKINDFVMKTITLYKFILNHTNSLCCLYQVKFYHYVGQCLVYFIRLVFCKSF